MSKTFMKVPSGSTSTSAPVINTTNNTIATGATTNPTSPSPGNSTTVTPSNAYVHNTTNSPPSTKIEYGINFLPNFLDNFDVVTYHWKLFITSTENAAAGTVLTLANQVIIAESGVSELTIDKIEMHAFATPTVETGVGTATSIKFEIVEPAGASLIDQLYYQSLALGVGNFMTMPMFIQLSFRGRDPISGETVTQGSASGLDAYSWVWPISIGNVKANVTEVGTRYEFETIPYDNLAQSNTVFSLKNIAVLNKLTTFGQAMKDLQTKLNADAYEQLIENYNVSDTFQIIVDPILEKILLENPDKDKSSSRASDYIDFGKKTATFPQGASIDSIVNSLLVSTDTFQKAMQNAQTSAATPNPSNVETDQMKKLWRIITETKPIKYDQLRQDNAKAYTIYIVEYGLGVADVSSAQTGQTPDTKTASIKRFNEYIQKNILNKRYDYIFTGLNDQIIHLDLNMDFAYQAAVARFGGNYNDSALRDKGVKQKDMDQYTRVTKQLAETLQWINNAPPGTDTTSKIQQTQAAINTLNLGASTTTIANRYTTILNNAKPANKTNLTNQSAPISYNSDGTINNSTAQASLASAQSQAQSNAQTTPIFVSDVNTHSQASAAADKAQQALGKGKLRPIPYVETNQEKSVGSGIEPASNPGRARASSIFSQALYQSMGSLQDIKMTVKGDPYWLFPQPINPYQSALLYKSNMSPAAAIALIKNYTKPPTSSLNSVVNIFGSDNFIILRFRTPRTFNVTVGLNDPTPSSEPYDEVETFSGIYKVIELVSKFEMGKFTQELHCILDPVINLSDLDPLLKQIEQASGQSTITNTTSATSNAAIATIPSTAISQQPITGTNLLPGQSLNTANTIPNSIGPNTKGTSNIPSTTNYTPNQATAQALAQAGIKTI